MPRREIDVNPISHITADAIGSPGKRVFYIQAWSKDQPEPFTVILEKIQLQAIVINVENFIINLERSKPNLVPATATHIQDKMQITPPVDPLFRIGEFKLGYDEKTDLLIFALYEIQPEESPVEEASVLRLWCSRSQVRSMAHWSQEVISQGRPICPQCSQPMEPEGHFCPKSGVSSLRNSGWAPRPRRERIAQGVRAMLSGSCM